MKYLRLPKTKLCVLALMVPACLAQVSQFEGRTILEIQFSPGQPLAAADLAKAQPLQIGQPLRADDVAHAIDSLFATGRFQDIVAEAEPSGTGVRVRFVVQYTWFVGGVSVQGKTPLPPNRGEIRTASRLTLGTPFHDEDVNTAVESIQRLLQSNGFYSTEVNRSVERDDTAQQVFVTFTVKEGKRAKYAMPVVHGETKLSDDTILRATGWRIPIIHWWRQVTGARTRKGVQGLLSKYAKQDRLMAQVEIKSLHYNAAQNRVHPEMDVEPGPRVEVTSVEKKVSKGTLKKYVPIYQEGTVDNDLLVEGKRNLEDYLQSQGYYDATVAFRTLTRQDDLERIEYVISRGQRYKLVHLAITGNKYFDTGTIRERMFITPASFWMRHGRYSEAFRRKDEESIANLYRANGFREVKVVSSVQRDYQHHAGDIAVTVRIEEGSQWLVDELRIQGVNSQNLKALQPNLASSRGQPFSETNIAADREYVLTYYYEHGFPGAQFKAGWQVNGQAQRVNVTYTIDEGDHQYVRQVLTSGLRTTRQSEVTKQITLHPGDSLSPIEQTNIQKTFYDLGIFSEVDTAIENQDGASDHKYVLYNFEEANRYTLAVGVGAQLGQFGTPSTATLAASAGTTGFSPDLSLQLSRLNFLGLGHTITATGLYSSIEKRASLTYLQPRIGNVPYQDLTYSILYDNTLDIRTFASKREEASVQLSERFSKSLTGLFRFAYRRVSVSDVVIPVLLIPQLVQPVRIGILSASMIQDRRDNPTDPHKGIYNTADLAVSSTYLGSQRSFARLLLRNATYYRLSKNLVLARQTQLGIIQPFSTPAGIPADQAIPLPERFFSGGADSLRAFGYNEAGPRDTGAALVPGGTASAATGFPLGGNALFINNVELRFPFLRPDMQGVLFHDMGNVYSSINSLSLRFNQKSLQDFNYAVHAAGFGLRYRTPVGPVRADFAYAINPPSFIGFKGTPYQLLQCGPNAPPVGVCQPVQQNTGHFQFFISIGQTF